MPRPKERIPIVLKHIDWAHFINYIGSDSLVEDVTLNLKVITDYWNINYDQRLVQVLVNLDIITTDSYIKYHLEETDYLIENGFVKPEKILLWGTYGKDGKQPLKYIPLDDMDSGHIEAVLKTQKNNTFKPLMESILRKRKLKNVNFLSAWRKGDLIEIKGERFRLTSDGYEKKPGKIYCDTDKGVSLPYLKIMKKAKLIETGAGAKNKKY